MPPRGPSKKGQRTQGAWNNGTSSINSFIAGSLRMNLCSMAVDTQRGFDVKRKWAARAFVKMLQLALKSQITARRAPFNLKIHAYGYA